jgi:hypothetical protein
MADKIEVIHVGGQSKTRKLNDDGSITTTIFGSNHEVISISTSVPLESVSSAADDVKSATTPKPPTGIRYGVNYAKDATIGKWFAIIDGKAYPMAANTLKDVSFAYWTIRFALKKGSLDKNLGESLDGIQVMSATEALETNPGLDKGSYLLVKDPILPNMKVLALPTVESTPTSATVTEPKATNTVVNTKANTTQISTDSIVTTTTTGGASYTKTSAGISVVGGDTTVTTLKADGTSNTVITQQKPNLTSSELQQSWAAATSSLNAEQIKSDPSGLLPSTFGSASTAISNVSVLLGGPSGEIPEKPAPPDITKTGKIISEKVQFIQVGDKKGIIKTTIYEDNKGTRVTVVINTVSGTRSILPIKKPAGIDDVVSLLNTISTVKGIIAAVSRKDMLSTAAGNPSSDSSMLSLSDLMSVSGALGDIGTYGSSETPNPDTIVIDGLIFAKEGGSACPTGRFEVPQGYTNDVTGIGVDASSNCDKYGLLAIESPGGSLLGALSLFNSATNAADKLSSVDSFIDALDFSTIEPHPHAGDSGKASFANCIPKIPDMMSIISKLTKLSGVKIPKLPELPDIPGLPSILGVLGKINALIDKIPKIPTMEEIEKFLGIDNLKCKPGPEDSDSTKISIFKSLDEINKAKQTITDIQRGNVAQNIIGTLLVAEAGANTRIDPITGKPVFDSMPEKLQQESLDRIASLKTLSSDINTVGKLIDIAGQAKDDPLGALISYDELQKNPLEWNGSGNPHTLSDLRAISDTLQYGKVESCIMGKFKNNPLEALTLYEKLKSRQTQDAEIRLRRKQEKPC